MLAGVQGMSLALKWAQMVFLLLGLLLRYSRLNGFVTPLGALVDLGKRVVQGRFQEVLQEPESSILGLLAGLAFLFACLSMFHQASLRLRFALPAISFTLLVYFYPPDMVHGYAGITLFSGLGLPLSAFACGWRLSLVPEVIDSAGKCAACGYARTGLDRAVRCPECGVPHRRGSEK